MYLDSQGLEKGRPEIANQAQLGGVSTSGGGFSNKYSMPSYQKKAVADYFALVNNTPHRPVPGYAINGRGYPDLAISGVSYIASAGGVWRWFGGTAAANLGVAGIISLVNTARLTAGRPPVGWFHPVLYKYHDRFVKDVTSGNNSCTSEPVNCCTTGFFCTSGWDPVTGFGSLDVRSLIHLMMDTSPQPTAAPTLKPTRRPTIVKTAKPTRLPTYEKTAKPTFVKTAKPTIMKTAKPTWTPKLRPTRSPTIEKPDSLLSI